MTRGYCFIASLACFGVAALPPYTGLLAYACDAVLVAAGVFCFCVGCLSGHEEDE